MIRLAQNANKETRNCKGPHTIVYCLSIAVYCLSSYFFWLIRSHVDPTLAAFIVCGPLQFLVSQKRMVWIEQLDLE